MTDYLGRSNPNWCKYLVLGECVNTKREKMINCKGDSCEFGRTIPEVEGMRIIDDDGVIYIINDFNDIVLCIPYYVKTECGIEGPYSHSQEEAVKLATKIIEEFY